MKWEEAFAALPLIAILRGLAPENAVAVAGALEAAGFTCLEVPLNSPEPLVSIARIRAAFGGRLCVGAGTVLSVAAVGEVAAAGGRMAISPDTQPEVIAAAKAAGLVSIPGFYTASEAFRALAAGADALKLFPAEIGGPALLKALKAVLPGEAAVLPVGGVSPASMAEFRRAGAAGFGIGSALFTPGRAPEEVGARARDFVSAWRAGA